MKRHWRAGVVNHVKMEAEESDKSSVVSRRSSRSSASSTSSLLRARAKAEAARTRLAFTEQEVKAKIERAAQEATYHLEKAKKDAELEALASRKEAAIAEAEAGVWEAAENTENYTLTDEVGPSEEDKQRQTEEYVMSHFDPHTYKGPPLLTPHLILPLKMHNQHFNLLTCVFHQQLK